MLRLLFLITILSALTLSAKNVIHQSIVLGSYSTYENAKRYTSQALEDTRAPYFILKSKNNLYMVTYGIYTTKTALEEAKEELPLALKKDKPFRALLEFDLTSSDERILYSKNLPKKDITKTTFIQSHKKPIKQTSKKVAIPQKQTSQMVYTKKNKEHPTSFIDSISIGYGQNSLPDDVYRLGFQKKFKNRYFESENGYISGYYDLAFSHLKYNQDDLQSMSFTPVFIYYFNTEHLKPYLFGGIGLSYLSEKKVATREFSTHFQFEDRIGLGLAYDTFNIELGYFHYSNASIKKPNDGMDIGMLNIFYKF